ncbi:hypothetical protein ACFTAO_28705 [Paenibacillus rhizoplanae]
MATQSENELALLNTALKGLDGILDQYSSLKLSAEEVRYRDDLKVFYEQYKSQTLPEVMLLVKNNDYEGIRNLSQSGSTRAVNEYLSYTKQFKANSDALLNELNSRSIRQADTFTFVAFLLSTLLLLFFTLLIWRMLKNYHRSDCEAGGSNEFAGGR